MDGLRYSPDDPYYELGPVNTCLHVRACRLVTATSSWSPGMGEGRDWWSLMGVVAERILKGCQGE